MKELYLCPLAEVISFVSTQAIAMEPPVWGWEEDVFSTPEAKNFDDKTTEGGNGYES